MKTVAILLLSGLVSRGEVEFETNTGHSPKFIIRADENGNLRCGADTISRRVPIVVTVMDQDDRPIHGAVAALKRIQPDGYTEADVMSTKDSATDANGHVTIACPFGVNRSAEGKPMLQILGAITVVVDGYATTAIELEEYFAGVELPSDERSALAAKIVMKRK